MAFEHVQDECVKIVVIGVYFGELPAWMPYWLRSCADNPDVDFLVVTDAHLNSVPQNVKVLNSTLKEVERLCQNKLGLHITLNRPYKLCDFKPVYGLIFEDFIKDYDYWGHCDFDLIFGDILSFANRFNLVDYDKFLPLGHLALYRNTVEVNNYFKMNGSKCGSWQEVFTDVSNHAFDEVDGINSIYEANGFPIFIKRIFAEIKTYHKRFRLKKCDKNYKHQAFYYDGGKVLRVFENKGVIHKEEFAYVHFRRNLHVNTVHDWKDISKFAISPEGIIDLEHDIYTIEEIEKYNRNPGVFIELFETIRFIVTNFNNIGSKLHFELLALKGKIDKKY